MRLQRGLQKAATVLGLLFTFFIGVAFLVWGVVEDTKDATALEGWVAIGIGCGLIGGTLTAAFVWRRLR